MSTSDSLSSIISSQADRQFRELLNVNVMHAASVGGWQQELWDSVEETGLSLALVPEAAGGAGLVVEDAFEIIRLTGYRAVPLPLGDTIIAKGLWCAAGGSLEVFGNAPALLGSGIADAMPRLHGALPDMRLCAEVGPLQFRDSGASLLVHAHADDGASLLVLLDLAALECIDHVSVAFEGQFSVRLADLPVPAERIVPWSANHFLDLRAHGALLRSVQMMGALQRTLELGLQYAGERSQFGKAIGKFAPVQDMLVEAAAETAAAVCAANAAVSHWQTRLDKDALFCVAAAKSRCGEAAGRVSALIHQVHGAIGFTQEHELHHYTRRLWSWRDDYGTEAFWNRWLGERISGAGLELWPRITAL